MYDFTTVYSRAGTGSEKWDAAAAAGMQPGMVPFTIADMEFKVAPEIAEAVRRECELGLWGYTFAEDSFRQAVCGWMKVRHGWNAKPEWMVNTFGIIPGINLAVRAFTRPKDGVIVQPPVYPPFFDAATLNGRKLVENHLKMKNGRYEIDFEHLAACAKEAGIMLFCNPHNPGGRVWTADEVRRVARICHENGVVLFSDEIHCDLLMPGFSHYSGGHLEDEALLGNTLIAASTAKTFNTAGLPCATIFVPEAKKREAMERQKKVDGYEFNTILGIAATRAAYQRGGPWLDELLEVVEDNYRALKTGLEEAAPGCAVCPMEATYLAWVDFRAFPLAGEALTEFLRREAQFFANPGEGFGAGGEGFVRVNLACPKSVLLEAVERLAAACKARGYI